MSTTPLDNGRRRAGGDLALILLLGAVTAIGPFTMHALSPALPEIAADFEVSAAAAQVMLSLSLVAMAVMTLLWGPASDRFGRRPVMLLGLALAAAGSVLAAVSDVLWLAIAGRLLQAAGGAAGVVLSRAVAQDVFGSERAAGVIGQVTAVMVAAPMIAPTVSGLMVELGGWRAVFWLSAAVCAALVVWTRAGLAETAPAGGTGRSVVDTFRGFLIISRRRSFWRYAGYAAFGLSSFYYFVAIAPYVMREAFGQGPAAYGLYFMMLSGMFMVTNVISGPVTLWLGEERTLFFGAVLSVLGPATTAALLIGGVHQPWVLFVPGMLGSLGAGLAMPNAMGRAVAAVPERAGAASGLLGFSQFIVAAVATQAGGFLPHDIPLTVPVGMLVILAPGLVCLFRLRQARG